MSRLGKRERLQRRAIFTQMRADLQAVVSRNLKSPKPLPEAIAMVATRGGFVHRPRDETAGLKGNTHTRGISIGQRDYTLLKPGSQELAANKKRYR